MPSVFYILCAAVAVGAYLVGGCNGAIIFSKVFYHKDIREYGSKNPGFTNFKRVFGSKLAWFVFIFDLVKTIAPVLVSSILFSRLVSDPNLDPSLLWKFGAAFAGLFAMLGHAFPVWYHFKGGKTFTSGVAVVWFIDWRVALICFSLFLLSLLLVTKIMSLSSCLFAVCFPFGTLIAGLIGGIFTEPLYLAVWILNICGAILLIGRHHENLNRLFHGQEKKFYLFGHKAEKEETPKA